MMENKIYMCYDEGIEDYSAEVYHRVINGIYEIEKIVILEGENDKK